MKKLYNVNLEEEVVKEARELLEVGQSLSPVINMLLQEWSEKKKKKNFTEKGGVLIGEKEIRRKTSNN